MKMFKKGAVLATTALVTGLFTTSAFAQIETITVTTQKREQTLQETPVSVAVVTDAQIEQSQIRDAADLMTLVPSLRVAEFAASTNTEFSLRGIGTSSFNPGLEPSVGVFVDGVYRPRAGAAINDLLSMERVEVIRGPQSTLFGRNTPGGVVSFVTKEPEFESSWDTEFTIGNYGTRIAKGTYTGPLSDTVAFRIDGTVNQNDGFLENVSPSAQVTELNNRDRWNTRAQLLWTPGDNTVVRVIADYGNIDENCCAAPFGSYDPVDVAALSGLGGTALPADPFDEQIAIDGLVNTDLTTSGISAQIDHDFENFTLTSITAFRQYDEDAIFDADFSDLDLVSTRDIGNAYDSFTQEFRITSVGDNRIDWMAGAFFYKNELEYSNTTPYGADARDFFDAASAADPAAQTLIDAFFGPNSGQGGVDLLELFLNLNNAAGVGGFQPLPSGNAALPTTPAEGFIATTHGLVGEQYQYDTESWSAFAQFDFHVNDQFTITVGGRYSEEDKEMTANINQPDPISTFSFRDLARDLRLVDPALLGIPGAASTGTCDPAAFALVGGDACGYLVPILLLQQGLTLYPDGTPINPANPLPAALAGTAFNPLLGFEAFQNFPPVSSASFPTERSDSNFSGSIIFSYDVSDTLNLYASYSTGYKPGGFNVSTNAAFTGFFEFEEETAEAFEVGAKGALFDNTFVYAITYFNQEITDFQSNNFVGNGFALENAGSIEVSGIEFEGSWAPTDELFFTGGFTYLIDNKYGEYEFAPCPDVGVDGTPVYDPTNPFFASCLPGNERTNNAGIFGSFNNFNGVDRGNSEFVASLTGTYMRPIGDGLEGYLRGEYNYTSEFAHTTTQDPRDIANQEGFSLFNASVGLGSESGSWEVQLWGRNLFEEEYTKGGFPSVGYLGTSYNVYPGDPRTYGLTLRLRG